jgi:hypothetical protein
MGRQLTRLNLGVQAERILLVELQPRFTFLSAYVLPPLAEIDTAKVIWDAMIMDNLTTLSRELLVQSQICPSHSDLIILPAKLFTM